jgi:hypothetical protein
MNRLAFYTKEAKLKSHKDEFFEKIIPKVKHLTAPQSWARAFFELGVAYGEWSAFGFDPKRTPLIIEELKNEKTTNEKTTTD